MLLNEHRSIVLFYRTTLTIPALCTAPTLSINTVKLSNPQKAFPLSCFPSVAELIENQNGNHNSAKATLKESAERPSHSGLLSIAGSISATKPVSTENAASH